MSIIETKSNPVGTAQQIAGVQNYIDAAAKQWTEAANQASKEPWWKVWKTASLEKMHMVTHFLLKSLDDLILYLVEQKIPGPDKKATVLAAIALLYDRTAPVAMPLWLKPFSSGVKYYIISVLIASAIDWMVEKYKNGSWRENLDPEVQAMFLPNQLPPEAGGLGW